MTNVQLSLMIGIPSLLVILSWINNDSRFNHIERRLDSHDKRFIEIDRRFDAVLAAIHSDALEIMRSMTAFHERLAVVETKQR